jgi:carboxymethylenebutenolidase
MAPYARRQVLSGLAGLPLAAILADSGLARAAAARLTGVSLQISGGREVTAALAVPGNTPAPAVLLIHEWWGLNDQIKAVAAEFAREGYLALAVDLYDGDVATSRDEARTYVQRVDAATATETLSAWIAWLHAHESGSGKVGTVGWCFGGGWSLNASIAAPVNATVVYYGRVNRQAADLANLEGPVQGHFGTRDQRINGEMVGGFESEMKKVGRAFETHWYEADHAFANPTGARYDQADAQLAWARTLAFFKTHLM